ncbi:MAG: tRNA 2-thiouridine(34) synthase MnmA [Bacteroidales bacterium]|nr:tRNA 2-thiouridine(34) synthase MnmA [Bacteroidales bacterium]
MTHRKKVLVGMSGGVDSSAVCMMLQEQGYEVVGLTMRMWDIVSHFKEGSDEPSFITEARELARKLNIKHITLDIRKEFKESVVKYFVDEYMAGHTPNPCVMCNLFFKWKYLQEKADEYGCDFVATGHYARIVERDGIMFVAKGVDSKKDQSYFLWRLGQKELKRTLFPLGTLEKSDIKEYVLKKGFKEKAEKKESMEVCFVEKDYRTFLKEQLPEIDSIVGEGKFVDNMGKKLGMHKGFPYYTIGQRKGLEIALGEPAYVVRINPSRNTIRLGKKEELLSKKMVVQDVVSPLSEDLQSEKLEVRIRYRSAPLKCRVTARIEDKILVDFFEEASAITPGQSAVFYIDDVVVGGGIICEPKQIRKFKPENDNSLE